MEGGRHDVVWNTGNETKRDVSASGRAHTHAHTHMGVKGAVLGGIIMTSYICAMIGSGYYMGTHTYTQTHSHVGGGQ